LGRRSFCDPLNGLAHLTILTSACLQLLRYPDSEIEHAGEVMVEVLCCIRSGRWCFHLNVATERAAFILPL
jgi:hypothetical protein